MIDREWFSKLRFEAVSGGNVVETKLGTRKAVFIVENDKGEGHVFKTWKNQLGFHIREIPPMLTKKCEYNVDKLNEKLQNMIGNPFYDAMPHDYDRLFSLVTKIIYEHGVPGAIASLFTSESVETLPFILGTPGVKRRIHELINLTSSEAIISDTPIEVNGPSFPIDVLPGVTLWKGVDLDSFSNSSEFDPKTLHNNPLFIWGGAILDGFYSDEELLQAADFIKSTFGPIASRPDALALISQIDAVASLLAQYFDNIKLERLVRFCAYCGAIFDVHDKNGNEVCNGLRFL